MVPKICAWCGESWTPQRKESRTCSYGCGSRLREVEHPSQGKKREYPQDVVDLVVSAYGSGCTVAEVQRMLPRGFKAQTIIERHIPKRRTASKRHQTGELNHAWKGGDAGYEAAHWRVKSIHGSARNHSCVDCGGTARDWSYRGGDPMERTCPDNGCKYSLSPDYYEPRCVPCHRAYDNPARNRAPEEVVPYV